MSSSASARGFSDRDYSTLTGCGAELVKGTQSFFLCCPGWLANDAGVGVGDINTVDADLLSRHWCTLNRFGPHVHMFHVTLTRRA